MTTWLQGESSGVARRQDLRLVPAAVVVWSSALCGLLWGWWACVLFGAVGLVVAAVVARRCVRSRAGPVPDRRLAAAGALAVCGLLTVGPQAIRLSSAEHDPLREEARQGSSVTVRAVVGERPRALRSAGYADQRGGARSVLVPVDVLSATVHERSVASTGRVLLIAPFAGWSELLPGQEVTASGVLAPARSGELTVAVTYVRGPPEDTGDAPWWQVGAESIRAALRTVCGVLSDEPAGLLPGLVVGDTSALPERVEQEFLDAGLSHLTAVSGSNVAIICGAVLLVARALRAGPRLSAIVAGAALVGYVTLVGYEPSVLRAGVMGAVGLLALVLGRQRSAMPALAAAVCALVLYDPAMAVSMGFALSVVATAGLVLLAPRWSEAMTRRRVPAGVAEGLAIPVAAFVVTAPIIAGMAGEVSLVSVVANLLAAPVVAPVTVLGVVAAVLAGPWPAAAEVLVQVAGPGVSWLVFVAREAAGLPGAVVSWPAGWWGGLLAAGVAGLLVLALRYRQARIALALTLVALLVVLVPVQVVSPSWPPDDWAVVACDVGQGDGLVLATGEPGRAVVVDAGPEPGPLDRCLERLGVDRVPLVVLSHLHADHVGGLASVLEGRAVGAVAVGPGRSPRWAWREVAAETSTRGIPLVELGLGERLDWPSLRLEVIGPRYAAPDSGDLEEGTEINNNSLVVRANTAAGRVLLTGDVELAAQSDLLNADTDLSAEILKVPHHGSRYSLPPFMSAVAPRVALVSVGADNSYGHPNDTTLSVLTRGGALVARTDTGGDTAVVPDGGVPAVVRRGPST
ncbi:ComEC/Rec2 family competence protein [Prauserella cavernicola]|uniref:ComEC/Rec2 family competence protein n=1 Tax=Prauserella cavernicola TaxID=2800127 RepID=A0A934QU30_9PSEU|nr:ComEC/Rec2 family competence protein [Prauserella cavernicola]MBK1786450.1 ComEC/Rec2 family competence protein [Prauserella cavernicola]